MADLLKNIYNISFFIELTDILIEAYPSFNKQSFIDGIFDSEWDDKELKQRVRHISLVLNEHLSDDYRENVDVILKLVYVLEARETQRRELEYMILPDFIEAFGEDNLVISLDAMERITQYSSCEFAVRPFILKYPKETMKRMLMWTYHKHPMVRRLATEGCRPRLPWAMSLPLFKNDPSVILPILERLKNDSSESVRRSVANNLNDISKDNPDLLIELARGWKGQSRETDRLIKHACRTLLKSANSDVLTLFGFGSVQNISIDRFKIQNPKIKIGESLEFTFDLRNDNEESLVLRLEYALYYLKANGSRSRKIFKISEREYAVESITSIKRRQSFRIISTRKFYPGRHALALVVNGIEYDKCEFILMI